MTYRRLIIVVIVLSDLGGILIASSGIVYVVELRRRVTILHILSAIVILGELETYIDRLPGLIVRKRVRQL